MTIQKADKQDMRVILTLQYIAYQSEAELLNNFEIRPLKQTISDLKRNMTPEPS